MIVVAAVVLVLLLIAIVYLSVKIVQDINGNRAGWAAMGIAALLGILAMLALGFLAVFGLGWPF